MLFSKWKTRKLMRLAGVSSVCAAALSLGSGVALAQDTSPQAETILDTAGLSPVQKAGARGNLTGLFKSPRRLSAQEQQVDADDPIVTVAAVDAVEGDAPEQAENNELSDDARRSDVLKALAASDAGPEALKDADPDSRLGKIAAYRFKVLEIELLKRNLLEARKVLSLISLPEASAADLEVELDDAAKAKSALEIEVAEIRTGLSAVGGVNAELEADLVEVRRALGQQERVLADVTAKKNAAETFERTMKRVQVTEGELAARKADAYELLEAASNTPVTQDVVAEVHRLLDLPLIQ